MDQLKHVSISKGNSKMGDIRSVSLPAVTTCRDCSCIQKCYARRIERLRPNVRMAYSNNYDILLNEPSRYWREVESAIMTCRYFRFHVSGDIPSYSYLIEMVNVAARNKHCQILCFTKRYDFVNQLMTLVRMLPANLHIIFSGWPGLEMENPHGFPEAHVRFRDGTTTARVDAVECPGNCTECALTECGCWTLKKGEQVVFNEH